MSQAYLFPWELLLNLYSKAWESLWSLMARRPALKSLVRVSFLLLYPLFGRLVIPLILDEVPFLFLWYYGLWRTHWNFPDQCYLHHQYYFLYLVLFTTTHFSSFIIKGGRSLMYSGSLLVEYRLDVLNFSDDFLESSASFWATPTRARIWSSLRSLLGHLPDVGRLL